MIMRERLYPGLPATKRLILRAFRGSQAPQKMQKCNRPAYIEDKICSVLYKVSFEPVLWERYRFRSSLHVHIGRVFIVTILQSNVINSYF